MKQTRVLDVWLLLPDLGEVALRYIVPHGAQGRAQLLGILQALDASLPRLLHVLLQRRRDAILEGQLIVDLLGIKLFA